MPSSPAPAGVASCRLNRRKRHDQPPRRRAAPRHPPQVSPRAASTAEKRHNQPPPARDSAPSPGGVASCRLNRHEAAQPTTSRACDSAPSPPGVASRRLNRHEAARPTTSRARDSAPAPGCVDAFQAGYAVRARSPFDPSRAPRPPGRWREWPHKAPPHGIKRHLPHRSGRRRRGAVKVCAAARSRRCGRRPCSERGSHGAG